MTTTHWLILALVIAITAFSAGFALGTRWLDIQAGVALHDLFRTADGPTIERQSKEILRSKHPQRSPDQGEAEDEDTPAKPPPKAQSHNLQQVRASAIQAALYDLGHNTHCTNPYKKGDFEHAVWASNYTLTRNTSGPQRTSKPTPANAAQA